MRKLLSTAGHHIGRLIPRRRGRAAAVGLACLALVAAGCSDAGSGSSGSGTILRISGAPTGPITRNFNPYILTSPVNLVGGVSIINEPLFVPNPLKVGQETPWLASSWEFSPDGKSLTLHLRTGVKWTDGQPFSADDVAFTLTMLRDHPAMNLYGVQIADAKATDPATVVVTFNQPGYTQLNPIGNSDIVPKHIWGTIADPSTYDDANPVGTGPFMLDSWSPEGYLLKKNPSYWQPGLPKIDGLRYITYNSNTSANLALSQGQLDWAANFVNNIDKDYVSQDPANHHYWFPPLFPVDLCLNLTKPQYQNADVRKAISLALDRQQLMQLGEQNEQAPQTSPTGLVMPQMQQFVAPQYQGVTFKQDIPQAKQLLAQAGYRTGSDGMLVGPDGKPFTMTILTASSFTDVLTTLQVMTDQLKAVGIKLQTSSEAVQQTFGDVATGNYDASFCGPQSGVYSPGDVYTDTLASFLSAPIGQPAYANQERWKDPATDQLIMQYASTNDPNVQQQALNGLQDIMVDRMPVIPLYFFSAFDEYSTKSVTGWPDANNPYAPGLPATNNAVVVVTHLAPKK